MYASFRFRQSADEKRKQQMTSSAENYESIATWCSFIGVVFCMGTFLSVGYRYYMHKKVTKALHIGGRQSGRQVVAKCENLSNLFTMNKVKIT